MVESTAALGVRFRVVGLLIGMAALLAGCGPPATLKQRPGYWADQSRHATAYNHRVRFLVLHYTAEDDARSLRTLTGPNVSVQYLVDQSPADRDGKPIVRQLVPEDERAWQAGRSSWAGRTHLNDSSIGIEIVNQGPNDPENPTRWAPYSAAQIRAVIALARDIVTRYDIKPANVVGHSDIAPGRKTDPGPAFPWQALHEAGIGAWPQPALVAQYRDAFATRMPSVRLIQQKLAQYGYALPITGAMDARTHTVLRAFQMHFRPARYDGQADPDTLARLWALDAQYR